MPEYDPAQAYEEFLESIEKDLDCDYEGAASIYFDWTGRKAVCRCMICSRCGHHTGNTTQGHYWSMCKVKRDNKEHHFCCPGDCELYGVY